MKRFLLVTWGAGLMSFLAAFILNLGAWQVGFSIGMFNIFLTHQIDKPPGMEQPKWRLYRAVHAMTNLTLAITITFAIAAAWGAAQPRFELWELEPITFAVAYGVMHTIVVGLLGLFRLRWLI